MWVHSSSDQNLSIRHHLDLAYPFSIRDAFVPRSFSLLSRWPPTSEALSARLQNKWLWWFYTVLMPDGVDVINTHCSVLCTLVTFRLRRHACKTKKFRQELMRGRSLWLIFLEARCKGSTKIDRSWAQRCLPEYSKRYIADVMRD